MQRVIVLAFGSALIACNHLGLRPEVAPPKAGPPRTVVSTEQKIRTACHAAVNAKGAKHQRRREKAKTALEQAEARLQVVQALDDPATLLHALKDRDTAEATLADLEATAPAEAGLQGMHGQHGRAETKTVLGAPTSRGRTA